MDNSVTVTDTKDAVRLHLGLQLLNNSIEKLSKATLLNKSSAADQVLNDARDLIANLVFISHALLNENERLKNRLDLVENELQRISNIGVIKNG